MKGFLKIFSVVLLLLTVIGISAFANGNAEVSHVSWTDGTDAIYELTAEGTVSATVTVTNTTDASVKYVYMLKMTDNGVQADFDVVEVSLEAGKSLPYTLTLTAPSDISNVKFEATLWDDFKSPEPICRLGSFPCADRTILKTTVTVDSETEISFTEKTYQKNGKSVTEYFSNEEIVLADNKKYPEVKMLALDNSTKLDIKKPESFPGKTTIKVISADGEGENYRVDYKTSMVLVDNFVNVSGFAHENSFLVDSLVLPTGLWDEDNATVSSGESCQAATGSLVMKGYRNPVVIMELDMPEGYDVEGVPYICKDWILYSSNSGLTNEQISFRDTYYKNTKNSYPMYEIDIHTKADVVVMTQTTLPTFVDSDWTKFATKGSGKIADATAYAWINHGYMHGVVSLSNCATQSVDIPEGEEKVTYTMYNGNRSYAPYMMFIIPRYDVEGEGTNE